MLHQIRDEGLGFHSFQHGRGLYKGAHACFVYEYSMQHDLSLPRNQFDPKKGFTLALTSRRILADSCAKAFVGHASSVCLASHPTQDCNTEHNLRSRCL